MARRRFLAVVIAICWFFSEAAAAEAAAGWKTFFGRDVDEWWMGGMGRCAVSRHQGRRHHQEDQLICMPHLLLPALPGGCMDRSVHVGLFGVFDGHNGGEASEFTSLYLPHLLRYHVWSIITSDINCELSGFCKENGKVDLAKPYNRGFEESMKEYTTLLNEKKHYHNCVRSKFSVSLYRAILKEALSRALFDIDSAFSSGFAKDWQSGSTAVVVLIVGTELLAANIGDSKAFICLPFQASGNSESFSNKRTSLSAHDSASLVVKELTIDHHPERLDEKCRIEAAGGFVSTWNGVARVNGLLAVSRAIGDSAFKRFGVIAEPEFSDWMHLTTEKSYLVLTSDGVFERMELQDVCNLFHASAFLGLGKTGEKLDLQLLADTIVESALTSGSFDNLAVLIYPLELSDAITSFSNKSEISKVPTFKQSIKDSYFTELLPTKEEELCYELIERATSGVILPLQISRGPSSTIFVEDKSVDIKRPVMVNNLNLPYPQTRGILQTYQAPLICLQRPVISQPGEVCLNPEMFSAYLSLIEALPLTGANFTKAAQRNMGSRVDPTVNDRYTSMHERYILTKNIGRGSFGEIWFALSKQCSKDVSKESGMRMQMPQTTVDGYLESHQPKSDSVVQPPPSWFGTEKVTGDSTQNLFVLKRLLVEKGNDVYLSGVREKYFGEIFLNARILRENKAMDGHHRKEQEMEDGLDHIARYVESVLVNMQRDLWLIFYNEGFSLSSMLYSVDSTIDETDGIGHIRVLKPSSWWKWLKTTVDGQREMRSLIYQLLLAVRACHSRNITHRDIKPENMMIQARGRCSAEESRQLHMGFPCNLSMRIIDFGSAVDPYSLQNLYGPQGPTRAEQTEEYTPPESFLQRNWLTAYEKYVNRYDIWSIGVVMLELVLGTPHVFQLSDRTRALIEQQLEGWGSSALNTAYMLRSLMEMCILYPGNSNHNRLNIKLESLASWMCTEENLMQKIKERDPLGIGLEDIWALRLLRGLLQWYPEDRMSVDDALKHPYFHSLRGMNNHTT